jgi:hypothetical protein
MSLTCAYSVLIPATANRQVSLCAWHGASGLVTDRGEASRSLLYHGCRPRIKVPAPATARPGRSVRYPRLADRSVIFIAVFLPLLVLSAWFTLFVSWLGLGIIALLIIHQFFPFTYGNTQPSRPCCTVISGGTQEHFLSVSTACLMTDLHRPSPSWTNSRGASGLLLPVSPYTRTVRPRPGKWPRSPLATRQG